MLRTLLTAFLLAIPGHVIQGQISVDKLCDWNYTKQKYDVKGGNNQHPIEGASQESRNRAKSAKNKRGVDLYKVTGAVESDSSNCPFLRNTPKGNFNITVLGDESDMKRRLNIEWATKQTSIRVWVSFVDVTKPDIAVPVTGCFVFHIKQMSKRPLLWKKIQFDCLEIKRGVEGSFDICELGTRTACGALNIDTRKCSCGKTLLSASIIPQKDNGLTKYFVNINYREASQNMSVHFTVRKNGDIFYEAKENYNLSSSGIIPIFRPLKKDGNYTVQVSLFCLDFSNPRKNQECQQRVFDFPVTSPVSEPTTSEPAEHVLYAGVGCVSTVTICLLACLIYKLCKRQRGAQNSPLNNQDGYSVVLSPRHNADVQSERRNGNIDIAETQTQK